MRSTVELLHEQLLTELKSRSNEAEGWSAGWRIEGSQGAGGMGELSYQEFGKDMVDGRRACISFP